MNTILLPTDFSKVSKNAIDYAAQMALATKSKLVLMHVYHVPVVPAEAPIVMPTWEDLEKDYLMQLKKEERRIQRKYGKKITIECISKMGFVVDEIIAYAHKKGVDFVVMGIHGIGYLNEKLIGSNTTELIKKSICPVLVINENITFKKIEKIVLAFDYKRLPKKSILDPLKELIAIFKSKVFILNVVPESDTTDSIKKSVNAMKIAHSLEGIDHSFHFIENEDTTLGINAFVESKKADMIVIIPRNHSFLDRILHKNNTKHMAFHTSIPLLALHE